MRRLLVAVVPLLLIACTYSAPRALRITAPVRVVPGPSAAQLARGHWAKMAAPPIRLCEPYALWGDRVLIVIQTGVAPCRPAAAAYDPAANRWIGLAAPPRQAGQNPLAAWGGGRLVLVSPRTGFAAAWRPADGRWAALARLPEPGAVSISWTGRVFLVITSSVGQGTGRAWALAGSQWNPLPDLPAVPPGWYAQAPTVTLDGTIYALANEFHSHLSASVRLLRLTSSGWTVLPLPPAGVPGTAVWLMPLAGQILALGTACQSFCMENLGAASIIGPGAKPTAVRLWPSIGLPWPSGIAVGPRAVVATYSVGGNTLSGGDDFTAVRIYDPGTGRWLAGPAAPALPPDRPAFWTPYGVVSLGQSGGWLLRPRG